MTWVANVLCTNLFISVEVWISLLSITSDNFATVCAISTNFFSTVVALVIIVAIVIERTHALKFVYFYFTIFLGVLGDYTEYESLSKWISQLCGKIWHNLSYLNEPTLDILFMASVIQMWWQLDVGVRFTSLHCRCNTLFVAAHMKMVLLEEISMFLLELVWTFFGAMSVMNMNRTSGEEDDRQRSLIGCAKMFVYQKFRI